MMLYHDGRQRNRLLAPYISEATKRGNLLSIVTTEPRKDSEFLAGLTRRVFASRRKAVLLIRDGRKMLHESSNPVSSFVEFLEEVKEKDRSTNSSGWTLVTDWAYLFYNQFERVFEFEHSAQTEQAMNESRLSTIICCFRNEGLCSQDPKDILHLFGFHDRVMFRTTVFEGEQQPDRSSPC